MATAKKVPVSYTYVLELDLEEAQVLSAVLSKLSGDPESSARKQTRAIRSALRDVNVVSWADDYNISGSLTANS